VVDGGVTAHHPETQLSPARSTTAAGSGRLSTVLIFVLGQSHFIPHCGAILMPVLAKSNIMEINHLTAYPFRLSEREVQFVARESDREPESAAVGYKVKAATVSYLGRARRLLPGGSWERAAWREKSDQDPRAPNFYCRPSSGN
jgi:hypothetical protein